MKIQLPSHAIGRSFLLITSLSIVSSLLSFTKIPFKMIERDFLLYMFDSDPISFKLTTPKKQILADEEIEITITAYYTAVSPALLHVFEGANSFKIKVIVPEGFVQTGGDYVDYCGATLTTASPVVRYTLKGYFPRLDVKPKFRLLRGYGQADDNSLFVVKDELTLDVRPAPRRAVELFADTVSSSSVPAVQQAARVAFSDCSFNSNTPIINWYGEQIYARQHNGQWYAAYADGSNFKPQSWVQATGFTQYECFAQADPRTSGGSTSNGGNSNINTSAGCSYSNGQHLFNFYAESIHAFMYNGQWYAAYPDGNYFKPRQWLIATGLISTDQANCFAESDPRTNGGSTSNGASNNASGSSDCNFDPNTPIISWYGEQIFARQYNGQWYAAYADGSSFKPQSWVQTTGFAKYQCFAHTDPRTSSVGNSGNQGSNTQNSNGTCSVSSPRGSVDVLNSDGVSGWALDESDFSKTVLVEIYVNGVKVALGKANEDRSDLVAAFGNNPAARYHGFHATWQYNRQGTTNCTIAVKICGASGPLKTEQVVFHVGSTPGGRQEPLDGGTLPEVTVHAEPINGSGSNWTGWGGGDFNSNSGSNGSVGSNDGSGSHGGNGSGSNNSSNATRFLENYKLAGPPKRINDVKKLIDCLFGDVSNGSNYKYSVTIYADQPVNGTRNKIKTEGGDRRPGHTYFGLERYDSNTGNTQRLVMGFYVESEWKAGLGMVTNGAWGDDGGTEFDVALKAELTPNQFKQVIYKIKDSGTPNYNLVKNNCTTFACALVAPYIDLHGFGQGDIGAFGFSIGNGYNPADLGQDLRENMELYGNKVTVRDNGISPSSTKCNAN